MWKRREREWDLIGRGEKGKGNELPALLLNYFGLPLQTDRGTDRRTAAI